MIKEMKDIPRLTHIALWGYRCFPNKQKARLAPLTFLVGANSTGKTSFLAMLRAICKIVFQGDAPDFRTVPYDLGTFNDIVNVNGDGEDEFDSFGSSIEFLASPKSNEKIGASVTFKEYGGAPFPSIREFWNNQIRIRLRVKRTGSSFVDLKTDNGQWNLSTKSSIVNYDFGLPPLYFLLHDIPKLPTHNSLRGRTESLPDHDLDLIQQFILMLAEFSFKGDTVFASAPVRSRPRRTYDPARPARDSEGEYIPTYLATINHRQHTAWRQMKLRLEQFGRQLGLFDEITIKELGDQHGGPFQLQIRQYGANASSKQRNLIDVGYGVNQVLPLLAELLRPDAKEIFLLQQPEVHLHPTAQAALGSLFCTISSEGRQLVVETHSDYLINRVRMDIRDEKSQIRAEEVSILFFETVGEEVRIHSLEIDTHGNVIGAPASYRKFFMDEVEREIGF